MGAGGRGVYLGKAETSVFRVLWVGCQGLRKRAEKTQRHTGVYQHCGELGGLSMESPSITVAVYMYDWAQKMPGLAELTPNIPYRLSGAAPPTLPPSPQQLHAEASRLHGALQSVLT